MLRDRNGRFKASRTARRKRNPIPLFAAFTPRLSPATKRHLAREKVLAEKRKQKAERDTKALKLKYQRARERIRKLQAARPANARPTRLSRDLTDAEIVRALDKGQTRILEHVSDSRIMSAVKAHGQAILNG